MLSRPLVVKHAYKHGLSKRDILHAWEYAYTAKARVDGRSFERILVGPAGKGRDIQLVELWDERRQRMAIIHAMPLASGGKQELGWRR